MESLNKEKELCTLVNDLYESGQSDFLEKMINIFSDEKIESFSKALNNKAYYCYKNNYSDINGQSFYDYSLSLLSKAVSVDNTSYKSYMLMGEIYFKTHKYESSLNSYRQALNISQNINSLNNTAVMLHYLGKNEEAETLLKKASEISDSPIVWYNYALECACNHKPAEAKKLLLKITNDEDIDDIDIGRIRFLIEDYKEVYRLYEKSYSNILPNVIDLSIYLYTLKKLNKMEIYDEISKSSIELIEGYINEFENNDTINYYNKLLGELKKSIISITQNHHFDLNIFPYFKEVCYLYYCKIHPNIYD